MESNIQDTETKTNQVQKTTTAINSEVGGMITPSKPPSGEQPWQEWVDVAFDFLSEVPEQLGSFFADYKQPLITLGLIITAAITVYVTLSVLDAIDNIPLLSPILELVGLGYTIWFVSRYLLKASSREEFLAEFNSFKQQVVGEQSKD